MTGPEAGERAANALKNAAIPPAATTPARDLTAGELRDTIQEGVFRGVMKAVAVYALISLAIWFLVALIASATQYG